MLIIKIINKKSITILLFTVLVLLSNNISLAGKKQSEKRIVARGDNIEVTMRDLIDYKNYFKSKGQHPASYKELRKATIRTILFSNEAIRKNIVANNKNNEINVKTHISYAKKYMDHILTNYNIDENAIRSYYRSYPDKFTYLDKHGQKNIAQLNNKLKSKIKMIITNSIKNKIKQKVYQELKIKYNLKILNHS